MGIWFLTSVSLVICSLVDLIVPTCQINEGDKDVQIYVTCAYSWYYTLSVILSLTGTSLFIRVNLWLKTALHVVTVLLFVVLSQQPCSVYQLVVTKQDSAQMWTDNNGFDPKIAHAYYVLMVATLLHVIDRQVEYIFRLDFQWTTRLEGEKREAQTMGEINRILLENILPVHVAQRYLYNSAVSSDQLYSESYESCAVMFASIPNYSQFYSEEFDEGLKCLQLLNEIICAFDQVSNEIIGSVSPSKISTF